MLLLFLTNKTEEKILNVPVLNERSAQGEFLVMDSDGTVAVLWVPSWVINQHVISPHPSYPPQIQKRLIDIEDVQKEAKKEEYKDFVPQEDIRYMKEGNQFVANEKSM